jgi:hypothetical protein
MSIKEERVFGKRFLTRHTMQAVKKLPSKSAFMDWLYESYDFLRCFHGCRPVDVDLYYRFGFLPSDIKKTADNFDAFLKSINYQRPYDVGQVLSSYSGSIDKLIYFILDEEDFLDLAPHYIIYGSELMLSLAQNVDERLKYYLRTVGIPTIFQCDIPLQLIEEQELIPLFDRIKQAKGTFKQLKCQVLSNYSIVVPSKLDGRYITAHSHPTTVIYDLHAQEQFQNTLATCPSCQVNTTSITRQL